MAKAKQEIGQKSFTRCLRNRQIVHTLVDIILDTMKACIIIWTVTLAMLGYTILIDAGSISPEALDEEFQVLMVSCTIIIMMFYCTGAVVKSQENMDYEKKLKAFFVLGLVSGIVTSAEKETVINMILICCGIHFMFRYAPVVYGWIYSFKKENRSEYSIRAHLSGYALMAQFLNVQVQWIDLENGTVVLDSLKMNQTNLEKSVLISYAGIIAERMNKGQPYIFPVASEADARKAKSHVYHYFEEQVNREYKWFSLKGYKTIKIKSNIFMQDCQEKAELILQERRQELQDIMKFFEDKTGVTLQEWTEFWSNRRSVEENGEI